MVKNKTDVIISIHKNKKIRKFLTKDVALKTNVPTNGIPDSILTKNLQRNLSFIEKFLGKYPHKELYIDRVTQQKNPVYGLNQLPKILNPYPNKLYLGYCYV